MKNGDRVVLRTPAVHGNIVMLSDAEIISIKGSQALIVGEEGIPKTVPLTMLRSATEVYGHDSSRPNEMQVIDAIRR